METKCLGSPDRREIRNFLYGKKKKKSLMEMIYALDFKEWVGILEAKIGKPD